MTEALALRSAGITAPVLAWLHPSEPDFRAAIAADIDLGVSSASQVGHAASAALRLGQAANLHLKVDTGLSRNGFSTEELRGCIEQIAGLAEQGLITIRGIMSHLSGPDAASDAQQRTAFEAMLALAARAGVLPELRHLAATRGALERPELRYDLVRIGIGCYGLTPFADGTSAAEAGLRPAMTLRASVVAVRRITAGTGVSYDREWCAEHDTTIALVPLGYADGLPRQGGGRVRVLLRGALRQVVGRIAMDQCVVDMGDDPVAVGDDVVVFGAPETGAPTADDTAAASDTIGYDIVCGVGARVPRTYCPVGPGPGNSGE